MVRNRDDDHCRPTGATPQEDAPRCLKLGLSRALGDRPEDRTADRVLRDFFWVPVRPRAFGAAEVVDLASLRAARREPKAPR